MARRPSTFTKIIISLVLTPFLAAAIAGTIMGIDKAAHASAPAQEPSVSAFNDGFATSKQDDCQQGFAPACAWLKSN